MGQDAFLKCQWPIWRVDNFTPCIRKDYLQIFLPLLLVGISLVVLVASFVIHTLQTKKSKRYRPIPIEDNRNDRQTTSSSQVGGDEVLEETDSEESDTGFTEHLSLRRTMSGVSNPETKIDKPTGQVFWWSLEELAVMGQVALHLIAIVTQKDGVARNNRLPLVAQLTVWIYILILTTLRFFYRTSTTYPSNSFWGHTAALYTFTWLFSIIGFRSVFLIEHDTFSRIVVSTSFALSTALFLIAMTTRKGNRVVQQQIVDGLEPSHERVASLLSIVTFSWADAIVWKGFNQTIDLKDVWNLLPHDLSVNVLTSFRQTKKTFGLAFTLAKHFKRLLAMQAAWAALHGLINFAPVTLLRLILEYVQDPDAYPRNVAWMYVSLLFVSGVIAAVSNGQSLWIGRRISVRLRAIIVGEVYAKALRRKAAAGSEHALGLKKEKLDNKKAPQKDKDDKTDVVKQEKTDEGQANAGAIINLMAVDSFKVAEICAYLHFLMTEIPVQVVISVVLLYQILGRSSIAGIGAMVFLLPINYLISRQFGRIQKRISAVTDSRIQTTNEVLTNVRIIKYFAWEQRYEGIVGETRSKELKQLRNRYILWAGTATLWYTSPVIITFLSFYIYTVVEKRELRAAVAFPALALFSLLRVPLDQLADMIINVIQTKVSIDRVEEFLREDETEKYQQLKPSYEDSDAPLIGFKNGSFTWGSKNAKKEDASFQLIDLDVAFKPGELNIIAGPTGSGKTSLLMALLGEMTHLSGRVYLPGYHSREELYPDVNGLTESVAYCAQQPWLVNDTIKANILFASKYNEERYKAVVAACSLERDFKILDAGDMTEIGEKGISLSGGQKQRVSLARALYSNAKHVLLDDCLSAVDSHTAKWIYEHCILGPLMQYRTCILVTHNVALCVPRSKFVVVMKGGEIVLQGKPETIIACGALGTDAFKSTANSRVGSVAPSRVPSMTDLTNGKVNDQTNGKINGNTKPPTADELEEDARTAAERETKRLKDKEETRTTGSVNWRVYYLYMRSMGGWFFWFMVLGCFSLQQLGSVATSLWIRQWALQYGTENAQSSVLASFSTPTQKTIDHSIGGTCAASGTCVWKFPTMSSPVQQLSQEIDILEENKVDVVYWLVGYALLGFAYALTSILREATVFKGSLKASRTLHENLLNSILRAKFRFFDSTPLGRIMNRFSKDLEAVDQEVGPVAIGMLHSLASVIVIVVLISIITPGFLIAGIFISAIYTAMGIFYLRSSRELKRLESIMRSPLYQHFGETLVGITTIRAFGDERRFVRDNLTKIDEYNRPYIYLWAINRWLSVRIDIAGALVSFFAGAFILSNIGKIDSGLAGLSLTYAITFTDNLLWLVRLYAVNEQNMNSVERLREYLDVEQEGAAIVKDHRPHNQWPEQGALCFQNYSTRYRPDLDLVLKNVTFDMKPLEKVGIVGRTGAGKSSLALALFRALEAEEGKIVIDNVDISKIGLQDLRQGITMVPQDPTLFTGTIRNNLDPFGLYTDDEIFTALKRVQLIETADIIPSEVSIIVQTSREGHDSNSSSNSPSRPSSANSSTSPTKVTNKNIFLDLSSKVAESGQNLSAGQRQLLCLARSMLKTPKVILMDEATASIDYATDAKIQATIREMQSTTITIAHRLQTIADYDRVLVLDHGEVKEYDHPYVLIQKEGGMFREMCENDNLESLMVIAKGAYEEKFPKLVDV